VCGSNGNDHHFNGVSAAFKFQVGASHPKGSCRRLETLEAKSHPWTSPRRHTRGENAARLGPANSMALENEGGVAVQGLC
jgi:hypothetical protein